jgi:hypothetical protein
VATRWLRIASEIEGTLIGVHICESCREEIDPDAPDTVRAVELKKTVTMGPTVEYLEGMGVLFHEDCFPTGSSLYRRKPTMT